jgi:hypothetical protein
MLSNVVSGPIVLLRDSLAQLAAEPPEQEERLSGMVVRDELALDFANAVESLASLPDADMLDGSTMADLRGLYDRISVGPDDSLWTEDLYSPRWAEVRSLAAGLIERV